MKKTTYYLVILLIFQCSLLCADKVITTSGKVIGIGVADVDGNGDNEIIAATNAFGGQLYVYKSNGSVLKRWPQKLNTAGVTAPAIADIDNDGDKEIAIGAGKMLYLFHHDGTSVKGWPKFTASHMFNTVALGDLNGDSIMEVAAQTSFAYKWVPKTTFKIETLLHLWHADGTVVPG